MNQDAADRGRDVKLFGALFILVGLVDVLIIEFFPTYALKLFGLTIAGPWPTRSNCIPRRFTF